MMTRYAATATFFKFPAKQIAILNLSKNSVK